MIIKKTQNSEENIRSNIITQVAGRYRIITSGDPTSKYKNKLKTHNLEKLSVWIHF